MEEGVLSSKENDNNEVVFWADKIAKKVLERDKDTFVIASGITPSGTVHIGNLREEMTAAIVAKAVTDTGVNVRYYHSWDDFDRFRKVPGNIPEAKREEFEKYIGMPVSKVPDPFECHGSYADHFEKEFEEGVKGLGINPEYIYQSKEYQSCRYAEEIRIALQNKEKIKYILWKFKTAKKDENLEEKQFWPAEIYCENCWKDFTQITDYDGEYTVSYKCRGCGNESSFDFRKIGNIKLKWRIDWPMRWSVEQVDFEPGGKDHSTPGGSRTTAVILAKEIYDYEAPIYQMYDFVLGTGGKGKMSGSKGNVLSPGEVKKVYMPALFRYMYVSQKPVKEFVMPFDSTVNKMYEDFYYCERVYYGTEEASSETKEKHWKRVYELSVLENIQETQPVQVAFSQMSYFSQFFDFETVIEKLKELDQINEITDYDRRRLETLYNASKYWVENYAPEQRFVIGESKTENLSQEQFDTLSKLSDLLSEKYNQDELNSKLFELAKETVGPKKFFQACYMVLIGKERGPRLAELIKIIGEDKVREIIRKVV